jgi:uncharacterized peroxidase-related enzyme
MSINRKLIALDIDLPERDRLPEDLQKLFTVCEEKLGLIPNVLAAYSHEPEQLRAFSRFYNEIMFAKTGLEPIEREMIAVVVSSQNHCYYCLTAHGQAVRQYSGDPILGEQLVMNYRAADLPKRHIAMLDFAVKLTNDSSAIVEKDRQQLRDAGFNEKQIWDIANVASFYNMTNRVAAAVDMQPNCEYHSKDREPATQSE